MTQTMSKFEAMGRQTSLENSLREHMRQNGVDWNKCELSMSLSGRLKVTFDGDYTVNYSHKVGKIDWCSYLGDYEDLVKIVTNVEEWAKEKKDKIEILMWTYSNRNLLTGDYE